MLFTIPILTFIILVILKIAGVIAWSWWVVFIPVYIVGVILLALLVFAILLNSALRLGR